MMLVDNPPACAVFLDLDGTLIEIAATPDLVRIPPDLVPVLGRLSRGLAAPRPLSLVAPLAMSIASSTLCS